MVKIQYIDNFEAWMNEFSFTIPLKVRFSETDLFGHMNNTVPFAYFEDARIEYFNSLGLMKDMLQPDFPFMTVAGDLQCHFLKQTYFNEELSIMVKINSVGNSSFDIHYCAKNLNNEVLFVGRGAIILVDKKNGKSFPIPEDLRAALLK